MGVWIVGYFQAERFQAHMNFIPLLINPMKRTPGFGREMGNMIAVVGKRVSWLESGTFAHNFISFHHGFCTILIDQNPLSAQQSNFAVGKVTNGDKIMKACRLSPSTDDFSLW